MNLLADLQEILDDEMQKHLLVQRIMSKLGIGVGDPDDQLARVRELAYDDSGEHAVSSRDFGRGYAHAMRLIREAVEQP